MLSFHIKVVQTDRRTDYGKIIRGHKNFSRRVKFVLERVNNIVERENAGNQPSLLFPQCF